MFNVVCNVAIFAYAAVLKNNRRFFDIYLGKIQKFYKFNFLRYAIINIDRRNFKIYRSISNIIAAKRNAYRN